jgi:membrane-bound metal-dependent hydrolase YbcI (DUF457 family)
MMVGTHTLLPVCGCLLVDKIVRSAGGARLFSGKMICAIALCGFLPDVLSPHLSLEARQTSISHTLWAVLAMAVVIPLGARFLCKNGSRMAVAMGCWLAYVLHLAADAISGGIAWLYPWRGEVIGAYWIPAPHWIWYDAGFILLVWAIYRVFPALSKKPEISPLTQPPS